MKNQRFFGKKQQHRIDRTYPFKGPFTGKHPLKYCIALHFHTFHSFRSKKKFFSESLYPRFFERGGLEKQG